jgi:NADPH:quinone reductase
MTIETQPLPPLPATMSAIKIMAAGGPDVLKIHNFPVPQPKRGEVLIRVHAAGINRPDLLQRRGKYAPPPGITDIPGLEIAGEVVAIGPDTPDDFKVGSRVCALLAGGGYAEYAVAPIGQILPLPDHMPYEHGAALPECVFTVWHNVFVHGRFKAGETVLIHGGSSGIGTTAIQMLRTMNAGKIIVTVGTDDKGAVCLELGADHAINYKTQLFEEEIKKITGGHGVDIILDMVGGSYVPRNLECLAYGGRHVSIAMLDGADVTIDLRQVMSQNLTITGSTLRPRTLLQKETLRNAIMSEIWPSVMAGRIKPVIHAVFPLAHASQAHELMESGHHIGKIVLVT